MKLFSKLWWIFAIVGTIAAFLNPYIGMFGISNTVELGSLAIFNIIICCTTKKIEKYGKNKVLKVYMKGLKILSYVLPVIFFLIKLFVGAVTFIVTYPNNEIMAPYQVWSNPDKMSIVCLIVEMIFNILLLISFICKGKIMKRMTNEYE
ncbi:hypothetical protein FDB88_02190 [Clostridium sporogenes]|uniref:hypothetical protein n=1 Tax=Clostridium sporogenes TaxID=1509 RepID=UPI0013D5C127|nr:hypothetical protein [Clostridium sporogenes]NFM16066.1 hypothetical protein [Clostridium sporogenes]